MKNLTSLLFALLLVAAFSLKVSAQGSTEQSREVSHFSSVGSAGSFNVHIILGKTESVKVNADADVIDKIETVVEDHELKIRFKKSWRNWGWSHDNYKANIYVTAKELDAVSNAGSGSVTVDGQINTDNFNVALSGSGSIRSQVKANEVHASISGSGTISLSGSTGNVSAAISGSGDLKAKELNAKSASFRIAGSGNAFMNVDKEITASIAGSGSVYYSGSPTVQSSTAGSGRVKKVNE